MRYALILLLTGADAVAQTCPAPSTFTEPFSDTLYKDAASTVAGWGIGTLTLPTRSSLAAGSTGSQTNFGFPAGQRLYYGTAGDLNADNLPDVIMMTMSCDLLYGINRGVIGGDFKGWSFGKYSPNPPDNSTHKTADHDHKIQSCNAQTGMVVLGNFDGDVPDQDLDLIYLEVTNPDNAGTISKCDFFQKTGVTASANPRDRDPIFAAKVDCKAQLVAANVAFHWRSPAATVVDWNGDGKDDLIVGSSHGITNEILYFRSTGPGTFAPKVTLIANAGMATPIANAFLNASGGNGCPPPVSRGITSVMVADFDNNGHRDVIVGSMSDDYLSFFKQGPANTFVRQADIPLAEGAPAHTSAGDFDNDGDQDFVVGRNGTKLDSNGGGGGTCGGKDGKIWMFTNNGTGTFTRTEIADIGDDVDWVMAADLDNDGKLDVTGGSSDTSSPIYVAATTDTTTGYEPTGTALSKEIDTVNAATHGIVSVTVTQFVTSNISAPGRNITLSVSNDGGASWEPVSAAELPPSSTPHDFTSFGADLRWRADFVSPGTNPDGSAPQTPALDELRLTYQPVAQRRYSRSALALGKVEVAAGSFRDLSFSASFSFPSYKATVKAFDITSFTTDFGTLKRADTDGAVTVRWDAGELLRVKGAASRAIYTAHMPAGVLTRMSFDSTQSATLQPLMTTSSVAETTTVVDFVRGGFGASDGWKLYDVGHSSPVLVGAPTGDPVFMGTGYADFKTAQAGREPRVYIGSNSGMLHAFDAKTGDEKWAFIPYNLLPKLKNQRSSTGRYQHGWFIDGPLTVQDMFLSGQWRTVLVSGQAKGKGRNDDNYYFALDVTNPGDPRPLWEFSDPRAAAVNSCTTPTAGESLQCGVPGNGNQCCQYVLDGVAQQEFYCAPIAAACAPPESVLGETWSPPVPARTRVSGSDRWLVFFGSGYNNKGGPNVGRSIYAIDAENGAELGRWDLSDLPFDAASNPSTIDNTVPGGVALVDLQSAGQPGYGYPDRLYVGDLEGRLWKIDVSANASLSGGKISHSDWPKCVLFDAGDPDGDGNRTWAPITTRPAIAILQNGLPNVYFGTGGDDRAPDSQRYQFYSVYDDDTAGICRATPKRASQLALATKEWIVGDDLTNSVPPGPLSPADAEGAVGDRYWSDPVVVDGKAVFFASLYGKIDSVNVCNTLAGTSKVFGYATANYVLASGASAQTGNSIFGASSPYLLSTSKVRQTAVVRPPGGASILTSGGYGGVAGDMARPGGAPSGAGSDVLMQRATSDADGSSDPGLDGTNTGGVNLSNKFLLTRWREIEL